MKSFFARSVLFLLACSTGCARRVDFGSRGRIEDPAALLELNAETEAKVNGVKSGARLTVNSSQIRAGMPLFAALSRPNRLYLEIHDFFGKPQAVLSTDGLWLGLYRADENTFYNGPASAENTSRLLPLVLPPDQWVSLFLGQPPKLKGPATLSFDAEAQAYRVEIAGEGDSGHQTLWIHPEHHRVVRSELKGPVSYDVAYASFDGSAAHFPREMHLVSHTPEGTLDLELKGPELNPELEMQTFTPKAPPGAMSLPLPEGGLP